MYTVAAYSEIGKLVFEQDVSTHSEALDVAEDLAAEYEVVIFHPDGEEETF